MAGKRVIVDAETGEILTELDPRDRIIRSKNLQHLTRNKLIKYVDFVVINQRNIIQLLPLLNSYEAMLLVILFQYLDYNNEALGGRKKPFRLADIIRINDLPRNSAYRAFKGLKAKGVVAHTSDGIFINPYIALKGGRVDYDILRLFKDTAWKDDTPEII